MTRASIAYLSGGVGGARLLRGLAHVVAPEQLTAIVNTGDDFDHLGLRICPDLDTVMYNLAGLADESQGWGLAEERFEAMAMVQRYGGADWFRLGDRDLGTHLTRSHWLHQGTRLTEVTQRLCQALGIEARVLPMSDDHCETRIETEDEGVLTFQRWFVQRKAAPAVTRVLYHDRARATAEALSALGAADLIVIGPSNPFVSIEPILQLPEIRATMESKPVLAVSPIVRGRAVKGPLAAMLRQQGERHPSAGSIAAYYGELLSAMLVERGDEESVQAPLPVRGSNTVMSKLQDSIALARELIDFAGELLGGS